MEAPRTPSASSARHTSAGDQRLLFPALGALCARAEPYLYALLRAAFGIIMLTHGLPKVMGASHGSMADPMAGSINLIQNVMGLPFAPQLAFLVMLLESAGAIMLAVGLWTRLVAVLIVAEMAAISYALGPTWPWIDRGIEYPVLMGFLALYMVARGSGRWALERRLGWAV
ncbi:membrane protein [Bordetella ansorpii]|uniref:Membrane protein n=1 Tax=Bordetella ansorpii TaxID=288768 RepID=A0A157SME8_9BORD|nr:DoxX family protein [Bordetella ansorpii]SAI71648.1 membrane protein [Bordetella ansorpii]